MKVLTEQERQAAEILLKSVNRVSFYTYNELSKMLNPPVNPRFTLPKIIGAVSQLCFDLGLPLLSVKVVNQDTNKAGIGFYKLYCNFFPDGKNESPYEVERREREHIQLWDDWSPLLNYLGVDIKIPTSPKKVKQQVPMPEKQIRILPMSKALEFHNYSAEDIQEKYFLNDLIHKQKGLYYFREVGMNCASDSLVLFQFGNEIVASAIIKGTHKYSDPVEGIYKGSFEFFIDSIKVFEPIDFEELSVLAPQITRFSQVKQKIDWDNLEKINHLISQKQGPLYPDDIHEQEDKAFFEGAKKQVTVNAYERNPAARRECIKEHGCKCAICGFDFGAFYGEHFYGKIHVHHINPLHLVQKEYELNPKTDLVPVCPNCHMVLHAKESGVYSIEEVKAMIAKLNR